MAEGAKDQCAIIYFAFGLSSPAAYCVLKASNIGRSQGSIRRSICRRNIVVSLTKFRNREPVLARGIGRLTFEFTAPPMTARLNYVGAGNSKAKSINRFLPRYTLPR